MTRLGTARRAPDVGSAGAGVLLPHAAAAFSRSSSSWTRLASLAWARISPRKGAAIVAASMTGALLFGLANHVLRAGADHLSPITRAWRGLFSSTAGLLFVTEAAGVVGLRGAMNPTRRAS